MAIMLVWWDSYAEERLSTTANNFCKRATWLCGHLVDFCSVVVSDISRVPEASAMAHHHLDQGWVPMREGPDVTATADNFLEGDICMWTTNPQQSTSRPEVGRQRSDHVIYQYTAWLLSP